ncbi:MAG TPA: hypothetical protein PLR88_06795, partial [Bacteroidales bacterium]|nr:hypothetical protein [Bacteroidales bacterium]
MKTFNYKPGSLLFITLIFTSLTLSAQEVTKKFHKEYTAGANTTLDISNRYGDVVINSWEKDQVVIDVKVTVELPNREKAEKLLSYIDVQFAEGENRITAKTVIDDKFSFTGWGGDSKRFSIDYTVSMPAKTALALSNKYGNSDIDELNSLVNLNIKYGNLTVGKLTRGNEKPLSTLNIAYGKGSIDEAGWLDLTARYVGNLEIEKSQALLLNSKYSKLKMGETSSIVGESKYDNIRIENINNLVLENGYTETIIGSLAKKLSYKGNYGSFTIEQVPSGFESIDIETHYMGVRVGIDESANYKLNAKVAYGGLKYNEDNFKNQKRIVENNSTEISG